MSGDSLGDLIATLGSIDDDEIDWPNVRRTTVLIHQTFHYAYPSAITALRQRLIVVPADFHDDQRLVTYKSRVSGCNVDVERSYDTFGNVVLDFSVEQVERDVEFSTWVVVEREAANEPDELSPDARVELASAISRLVHDHFTYDWGITSVATTAAEAWRGAVGVCQDYAHCMVALCRLCGLPARYVSGHLLGEGGTHAWVEVLVAHPGDPECFRSVAFDPTHDTRPGLRYVTVAVGRDYGDVPPTSGTFEGPFGGELTTHKRAAVTRVEYLRPRRRRRSGPVRLA
jgi:transglutaminase-like putative cysteine protease